MANNTYSNSEYKAVIGRLEQIERNSKEIREQRQKNKQVGLLIKARDFLMTNFPAPIEERLEVDKALIGLINKLSKEASGQEDV